MMRTRDAGFYSLILDKTRDFAGREWLFSQIKSWLTDPKGPRFFLITGKAGTGKSAISARLWQISEGEVSDVNLEKGFLSAIHVCSRRDAKSLSPINFSESLANQLSEGYEDFGKELIKISSKYVKEINVDVSQKEIQAENVFGASITVKITGSPDPNYIFQTLIWNPLERLIQKSPSQRIVILIDALDESLVTHESLSIVSLITNLETLSHNIRFIMTLREDTGILGKVLRYGKVLSLSEKYYEKNNEDISQYINFRITNESKLRNHYNGFIRDLTTKAEDNFLYVAFLLDAIVDGRLELKKESLDRIPPFLDGLYHDFLSRIKDNDPKKWNDELKTILAVLSVVYESVSQRQLAFLTGINPLKIEDDILGIKSFIRFTNNKDQSSIDIKCKLYHQSLIDFLFQKKYISKREDGSEYIEDNVFYIPKQQAHRTIVEKYYSETINDFNLDTLDSYGLRYVTYHLTELIDYEDYRAIDWYEKLVKLAEHENFEKKQLEYFPLEPDLNLRIKRQVFLTILEKGDPVSSIEMLLIYINKINKFAKESPLDALRYLQNELSQKTNDAILRKAWMLADVKNPEITCIWFLIISWALDYRKKESDVKKTLNQLNRKTPSSLLFLHELAPPLVSFLYEKYPEVSNIFDYLTSEALSEVFEYYVAKKLIFKTLEISRHIRNPFDRSRALCRITELIVFSDRDEAKKFLDEAIFVAETIEDHSDRSSAFSQITQLLAGFDTDRAIFLANKIDDSLGKIHALSEIAKSLASTNRDKSEKFLAQALAIGNKIEYKEDKLTGLTHIAKVLGDIDIERAISIAKNIDDSSFKSKALFEIGKVVASTNPKRAEKLLDEAVSVTRDADSQYDRSHIFGEIAQYLITVDIERAISLADRIHPDYRPATLFRIIQELPSTDRNNVENLVNKVASLANKMYDSAKSEALVKMAQVLASTNRNKSQKLLDEGIHLAKKIKYASSKFEALIKIAQLLGPTDRDKAEKLLDEALDTTNKEEFSGSDKSSALSKIALVLMSIDRDKAEKFLDKTLFVPDEIDYTLTKSYALSEIAQALASTDTDQAIAVTNLIDDVEDRTTALNKIAKILTSTDIERATVVTNKIERPDIKDERLGQIAQVLAITDINGAISLANKIDEGYPRSVALNKIAQILTSTDIDRAIAVTKKIEEPDIKDERLTQIARNLASTDINHAISLANKGLFKVTALTEIAQALASTDISRAVAVIHRIRDPADRAEAFAKILASCTNTNNCEKLLREALAAVNQLKDSDNNKSSALSQIAQALASTDIDQATALTNRIADPENKFKALTGILILSINTNRAKKLLDEAISVTNDKEFDTPRDLALSEIAQALAYTKTEWAISVASKIEDPYFKKAPLSHIAQALASKDLDQAIAVTNKLDDPHERIDTLVKIAQVTAPTNRDKAENLLNEAISVTKTIQDAFGKVERLTQIAQVIAPSNKDKAEKLLDEAILQTSNFYYDNDRYRALSEIVEIMTYSRLGLNGITRIIDIVKDPRQLYRIVLRSTDLPNKIWIGIIKQLMNYPENVYLICLLICKRNIQKSKDIINLMMQHTL